MPTPTLIDYVESSPGVWVQSNDRLVNLLGTPLTSVTPNYTGEALPDIYTLIFASVVPATSATVKVACQSPKNPFADPTGQSVNLDGTTVYKKIIRGYDLVFSNSGSFTNSWSAELHAGVRLGALANHGVLVATTGVRHKVINNGTGATEGSKVSVSSFPIIWVRTSTNPIFEFGAPFSPLATPTYNTLGDGSQQVKANLITLANVTGSGGSKTMDVKIGGSTFSAKNLTTNVTATSTGQNVNDVYEVQAGNLQGWQYQLSQDATNGDTAKVLVYPRFFAQIAEDISGSAGTYGITDVNLTETGQPTGVISASGEAFFWLRALPVVGGNAASNPFIVSPELIAIIGGSAEFL